MASGSIGDKVWLVATLGSAAAIGFQLCADVDLMPDARAAHPDTAHPDIIVAEARIDPGSLAAEAGIDGPPTELMTAAIIAQPLFSPGREPAVQEAQAIQTTRPRTVDGDLPALELAGTLISDHVDVALIVNRAQETRHLRIGDQIADWQIARIGRDQIELVKDGEMQPMPLRKARSGQ